MATLVLTAMGTALGGPIGGAIGAVLGQGFDQNVLFKPKGREGPRLSELDVQTSTYGSQVPQIFGAMRVAGTVIWATDLNENKQKSGGGKGRPSVTSYSYSVSFAVAISSRPILRVGRIWADGNLLRGMAGDFKTELGAFRLFTGDPDQDADQLMASAEGAARTPAHRGFSYVVFEDLQLADYGNRIPSLTFEVFADEGEVGIAAIADALSGGKLTGTGTQSVMGFVASGQSVADAVEPLVSLYGLRLRSVEGGLMLDGSEEAAGTICMKALAGRVNGKAVMALSASRQAASVAPRSLAVRYYDAARDYQAGLQKATRPGAGRQQAQFDLPAVISATDAKRLANARVVTLWKERNRLELTCDWRQLALPAGNVVTVAGVPGLWCIDSWQWEAMALRLSLRQIKAASGISMDASSGAPVQESDVPHGTTTLYLADLPGLEEGAATAPSVVAAAAGASPGWRRASLFVEQDDDVSAIGQTGLPCIMGTVMTGPAAGNAFFFDDAAMMEVELLAEGMVLTGASDDALLRGANLCLAGDELLQFGRAEQWGARHYRLSHLLRGRRGTEWAMAAHDIGEPFMLIEADSLTPVPNEYVRTGDKLTMLALGIGDVEPTAANIDVTGNALKPIAPVHLRMVSDGAGGLMIGWTRRSRAGWAWHDFVDAPLGEEFERYRLRVLAGGAVLRTVEIESCTFSYDAAMASADTAAAGGEPLLMEIVQLGSRGISKPLIRAIQF